MQEAANEAASRGLLGQLRRCSCLVSQPMTGHWGDRLLLKTKSNFRRGSNGGFWSWKVENALSFNGGLTDTLSAISY